MFGKTLGDNGECVDFDTADNIKIIVNMPAGAVSLTIVNVKMTLLQKLAQGHEVLLCNVALVQFASRARHWFHSRWAC